MKAFNFYNTNEAVSEIDLVIDSPIPYKDLRQRAVTFALGDINVPVASIRDLIELKVSSGRKQDLADVEHLGADLTVPGDQSHLV